MHREEFRGSNLRGKQPVYDCCGKTFTSPELLGAGRALGFFRKPIDGMEVGTAAATKPICLAIPKTRVVCHVTPPDDDDVDGHAAPRPKNVYSLSPSSRSPSPSRRRASSFLQDAYRALIGGGGSNGSGSGGGGGGSGSGANKSNASLAPMPTPTARRPSCLLDVPKDGGQFRNRSKSLDDGSRKTLAASGSAALDSGDAYKIFESILKEGTYRKITKRVFFHIYIL